MYSFHAFMACGHRVVCVDDFNRYLSVRIHDGDILPWIPCPAETCFVPCHVDNIIQDGNLTYSDLLSFLTTFMLKKLSRNENFIVCVKCEKGGFLQFHQIPHLAHSITLHKPFSFKVK
ncbi:unnamed protein product [Rotaria sp. Silwood2]|nr:unnamed protein product [Rotaria sp. Silwood2]